MEREREREGGGGRELKRTRERDKPRRLKKRGGFRTGKGKETFGGRE